jgi:para-aminobenzoate synthetase component 1
MMIVDLVRNDLAKSAESGTVKVDEIFGIYSFQQVHQMISTIAAHKRKDVHACEVIENAFPMGSMTGAPKIRAMQLIEDYECSKRNVFSGSIGYFNGDDEFDFNVLIRSIYYDEETQAINYQVGSAITYDSDPEAEYEECLLKAKAIENTLGII